MKSSAALAMALLGFGCSSASNPSPAPSEPTAAATPGTLGTLHTRDRDVWLYATPSGLKVTIKAKTGALVADQVDIDTLRTTDPQIYDIFRAGVANGRPYLDATLDQRSREQEPQKGSGVSLPDRH
jgi:hypothetical protein